MRGLRLAILLLLLPFYAQAYDAPGCASTIRALRTLVGDPLFSIRWAEVSMNDGKPLIVSIIERDGALSLEFIKTGEGTWAEVSGVICKTGGDLEVRTIKEQVTVGPAANWIFSLALANGSVFAMHRRVSNEWQIETRGWSGRFVPALAD